MTDYDSICIRTYENLQIFLILIRIQSYYEIPMKKKHEIQNDNT